MKDRLLGYWEALHSSFWFVPASMAVGALLLSIITLHVDRSVGDQFGKSVGLIWSGGSQGARSLLSTIAGSMITVAGTVFSITIVALTLASSQFGPRLLRSFVRDTGNQVTLGTFTATFLYSLLVLRTIRAADEGAFVPFVSVTTDFLLAIASVGVLIYFIHHVSSSIQAENLIARVGRELSSAVEEHFPSTRPEPGLLAREWEFEAALAESACTPVRGLRSGYVQAVNRDRLMDEASECDLRLVLECLPGDFVLASTALCVVRHRADRPVSPELNKRLGEMFKIGEQRTEEQDVRYGGRQLAEIACRALSPGINDPFTAMGCMDWMSAALALAAQREPPRRFLVDDQQAARLREQLASFADLCDVMWQPIVDYGLDSAMVVRHAVDSLARIAAAVQKPSDADALRRLIARLAEQVRLKLKDEAVLAWTVERTRNLEAQLAEVMKRS